MRLLLTQQSPKHLASAPQGDTRTAASSCGLLPDQPFVFQSADRSLLISGPPPFDLVLGHVFPPNDSVAANEIVRAAREIPTTNGRKQRHSFTVKRQLPTNGTN